MPVKKLTARFVETVKGNGVDRVDFRDTEVPGLELRVTPSGGKGWSLLYRTEKGRGAQRKRLALGSFPAIDLEAARKVARQHVGAIAGGGDPSADQRRVSDRVTMKEMGAAYLEKHAKKNKRSWRGDEIILKNDVYPTIGSMRPGEVKRADVQRVLDRVIGRGSYTQANRTLALLSGLFSWGIGTYVDHSPTFKMPRPSKERTRERVLSADEIRTIWGRVETGAPSNAKGGLTGMREGQQIAIKLLLLLGQRRAEVAEAARSEIDLAAGIWTIPGARTKNGRTHRVPLPPVAVALFRRAFTIADEAFVARQTRHDSAKASLFVFPSRQGANGRQWGEAPIGPDALNNGLAKVLVGSGVEDVTLHDFRRTMATYLAEIGTPETHIGALLNHTRAGVTAKHYALYAYDPEKRAALETWEQHTTSLLGQE